MVSQVDLILHPLRSELNFPIGKNLHHDLSNVNGSSPRWQLPSFLLSILIEAATDASRGTLHSGSKLLSEYPFLATRQCQVHYELIVTELCVGAYDRHIRPMPLTPKSGEHFAFLEPSFYRKSLMQHVSKLALYWVFEKLTESEKNQVQGLTFSSALSRDPGIFLIMSQFIQAMNCSVIEISRLRCLGPTAIKLLNLAKQWVITFLPHCCSLFNRVHYGLLQPKDIERLQRQGVDTNCIPGSRLRTAVPFIGKDCPSRASEFAQPDICAGLTILAYRYEGLRRKDLQFVVQVRETYLS